MTTTFAPFLDVVPANVRCFEAGVYTTKPSKLRAGAEEAIADLVAATEAGTILNVEFKDLKSTLDSAAHAAFAAALARLRERAARLLAASGRLHVLDQEFACRSTTCRRSSG